MAKPSGATVLTAIPLALYCRVETTRVGFYVSGSWQQSSQRRQSEMRCYLAHRPIKEKHYD